MTGCNSIRVLPLALACLLLAACGGMPAQQAPAPAPAVAPAPREARAQFEDALDLLRDRRYAEAAAALQVMTQAYPDLPGPHLNLGLAFLRLERAAEAAQSIRRALEIKPGDAEAYNLLGLALREAGDFDGAREAYEQALKLDPRFADVHLNLAILLDLYLGQALLALEHYERYQEIAGAEDRQVKLWITDLKQRLPAPLPAEEGGS